MRLPSTSSANQTDENASQTEGINAPEISMPKGGGAIKGIDEKFSVNAINGSSSFSIPLPISPARGVTPTISIAYNSGAGNGTFGLGWGLSLGSIKRKTDQGLPQYRDNEDSDTFLFAGAEDLVPAYQKDSAGNFIKDNKGEYLLHEIDTPDGLHTIRHYLPRIEGLYARIERWMEKGTGKIKWRVIDRNNSTTLFGWTDQSVIANPENPVHIFEWLPEFVFDDKGNCSHYIYKKEDTAGLDPGHLHLKNRLNNNALTYTNTYLSSILYGNKTPYKTFNDPFPGAENYLFSTRFDYGEYEEPTFSAAGEWTQRPDAFSSYRAGFEVRTTRLCKSVLAFHHFKGEGEYDGLVKGIHFGYDLEPSGAFSLLKQVVTTGYIKKEDGSYSQKSMPPLEFGYEEHSWNREIHTLSKENLKQAPSGLGDPRYSFVDLYNEGLAGILTEDSNAWYYKRNLGDGKFEPAKSVAKKPSFAGLGNKMILTDLEANGTKQFVGFQSLNKGFFELTEGEEWMPFRSFETLPNIDLGAPHARMTDLTGDGKPELLVTEANLLTWYPSEGKKGFSQAKKVTNSIINEDDVQVVFADPLQQIFLADMSGDGMTDIVRIQNGSVSYWPNLGYGKFGALVAMDDAPVFDHPESFNPALIRLVDIDGSGTTDIIYLGKNKFSCWSNLNGNAFGKTPFEIDAIPEISAHSSITVTDLLGNGVACIVFSSSLSKNTEAPLKYIDLMGSKKPHLMVSYKNNLGKEVALEYTPSTRFYIEDKLAGRPWVTKLHFPVHCISKTEVRDHISGTRFSSQYSYHHGYYDHEDREFRGFGMVEQIDSETYEDWAKGAGNTLMDEELCQEPIISRKWNHTGAFANQQKIARQLERGYWYEKIKAHGYDPDVPEKELTQIKVGIAPGLDGITTGDLKEQEWREAYRACKGATLRSEVFAKDAARNGNSPDAIKKELTPFSVSASAYTVELLQPKGKNKHAVYTIQQTESLTYAYERNFEDPRIAHKLVIETDEIGNVLESASVVYPRLPGPNPAPPAEVFQKQDQTVILYNRNRFTNDVKEEGAYRLRQRAETTTFELNHVAKSGEFFYEVEDFRGILSDSQSTGLLYHQKTAPVTPGLAQRRLIEQKRLCYFKNDLSGPLPLYQLESLGLPFESYRLAFTPELLADVFDAKVNEALLLEGKYTHFEGDTNWWISSGTMSMTEAGETAADAANRFFMPLAYTDAYGATTKVKYNSDTWLLVEETEDVLGNKLRVMEFDFRSLSPAKVMDPNLNLSEVITDELGFVKASAVLGKGNEADSLSGLTNITEATERNLIRSFFQASDSNTLTSLGKQLLNQATTRFVYDFNTYLDEGKPVVAAAIQREEHFQQNSNSPVTISFEYSGGLGEVIMNKIPAEPGPAKQITINPDGESYQVTDIDTSALPTPTIRWVGNGRTILNNKGNPVKEYEPYFSVSHQFEDAKEMVETGISPVIYYDAAGRATKTEMPDGTLIRTTFDPWQQIYFDPNDTVLESDWYDKRINRQIDAELIAAGKDPVLEELAAEEAAKHAETPLVKHLDAQGRPVMTIAHNRDPNTLSEQFNKTQSELDTEGNILHTIDARGNTIMSYKYDMLGNVVFQNSLEAGKRWRFPGIAGKPIRVWDERNHLIEYAYDIKQRPVYTKVTGGDGTTPLNHIVERIFYGGNEPNAEQRNLRGRVVRLYDTGGLIETNGYDFTGSPLSTERTLFKKYKETANWIDPNLASDLETSGFSSSSTQDAMGRIVSESNPDGSEVHYKYNERGLLKAQWLREEPNSPLIPCIESISYNEKGLRTQITYHNGVRTRFYYDPETQNLQRLESKRNQNEQLQDFHYTYDPVGNITHIHDKSIPVTFFNNQVTDGLSTYVYDALNQLVKATGRENSAALAYSGKDNWEGQAFTNSYNPGDPLAVRNYEQLYAYDEAGNITQMRHVATGNSWTRNYQYNSSDNKLLSTQVGSQNYTYSYHPKHGFMTSMPHLEEIVWNHKEEIAKTVRQKRTDGGTPETTYYQYDGEGQRIRKITENQAAPGTQPTVKESRIYLGNFEVYSKHSGTHAGLKRTSLSLSDEGNRYLMIEKRNAINDGTEASLMRYQLQNHQGSASMELDESAEVISYEEYHPFGTTAYQAKNKQIKASAKRYRYTGMERDDETGMAYHSARYYLPWLGRWLNCDPIGPEGGLNLYAYCENDPVNRLDPSGNDYEFCGWDIMPVSWGGSSTCTISGTADVFVDEAPEVAYEAVADVAQAGETVIRGVAEPALVIVDLGQAGTAYFVMEIAPEHYHDPVWMSGTVSRMAANPDQSNRAALVLVTAIPTGGGSVLADEIYTIFDENLSPEEAEERLKQFVLAHGMSIGVAHVSGGGESSGRPPALLPPPRSGGSPLTARQLRMNQAAERTAESLRNSGEARLELENFGIDSAEVHRMYIERRFTPRQELNLERARGDSNPATDQSGYISGEAFYNNGRLTVDVGGVYAPGFGVLRNFKSAVKAIHRNMASEQCPIDTIEIKADMVVNPVIQRMLQRRGATHHGHDFYSKSYSGVKLWLFNTFNSYF